MTDSTQTKDQANELDALQAPQVVKPKAPATTTPKKEEPKEKKVVAVKEEKVAKTAKKEDPAVVKYQQMVQFVQNVVNEIEMDIKRIKLILNQLSKFDPKNPNMEEIQTEELKQTMGAVSEGNASDDEGAEVVEGKFDGYFMVGNDQKKYPVPLNYSSKTKLVPGDQLKLKILDDGKFIYKLTNPVERKHIRALLSKSEENKFVAMTDDGKTYFLNQAAVTFFKGKPGDELYIVVNSDGTGNFAAIEAIIKK